MTDNAKVTVRVACPRCGAAMKPRVAAGHRLNTCDECGLTWLPDVALADSAVVDEAVDELRRQLAEAQAAAREVGAYGAHVVEDIRRMARDAEILVEAIRSGPSRPVSTEAGEGIIVALTDEQGKAREPKEVDEIVTAVRGAVADFGMDVETWGGAVGMTRYLALHADRDERPVLRALIGEK